MRKREITLAMLSISRQNYYFLAVSQLTAYKGT